MDTSMTPPRSARVWLPASAVMRAAAGATAGAAANATASAPAGATTSGRPERHGKRAGRCHNKCRPERHGKCAGRCHNKCHPERHGKRAGRCHNKCRPERHGKCAGRCRDKCRPERHGKCAGRCHNKCRRERHRRCHGECPSERPVTATAGVPATTKQGLAARQVNVRVGTRQLVSDLSVEFAPGEVIAILGRNGSGENAHVAYARGTTAGARRRRISRRHSVRATHSAGGCVTTRTSRTRSRGSLRYDCDGDGAHRPSSAPCPMAMGNRRGRAYRARSIGGGGPR